MGEQALLNYTGVPRELDFVKYSGWSQVVLNDGTKDELIAQTANDRIARIALLALALKLLLASSTSSMKLATDGWSLRPWI